MLLDQRCPAQECSESAANLLVASKLRQILNIRSSRKKEVKDYALIASQSKLGLSAKSFDKYQIAKFAWCLTGSGHYLKHSIQLLDKITDTDIFLSMAAEEVLPMYGYRLDECK